MANEVQAQILEQEENVESTEINHDEFFKELDNIQEDTEWFEFCKESFYMH